MTARPLHSLVKPVKNRLPCIISEIDQSDTHRRASWYKRSGAAELVLREPVIDPPL